MNNKIKNNKEIGFTLIEVLIVISIMSIFFISAVTIAIFSLQNLKSSENKILATRYAEELLEWIRGEKEADWNSLKTIRAGNGFFQDWCFNTEPVIDWPSEMGNCDEDDTKIRSIFTRVASLKYDTEKIIIKIKTSWLERNNVVEIPLNTIFSQYE